MSSLVLYWIHCQRNISALTTLTNNPPHGEVILWKTKLEGDRKMSIIKKILGFFKKMPENCHKCEVCQGKGYRPDPAGEQIAKLKERMLF